MIESKNIILIDWLSITTKIHSLECLLNIIGMSNISFQNMPGARGYHQRIYYDGISIHFDGTEDMGIWLEMSGQGCRTFETLGNGNYQELFNLIIENPGDVHITRIDIAFDDKDGIINIDNIYNDTVNQNYISKSKCWQAIVSNGGISVTIGSPRSNTLIRIYDKARERGFEDGSHWVRCELQLRDENALGYIKINKPIGEKYKGVLINYLRYIVPGSDTNKSRLKTCEYWDRLIDNIDKISVYEKPGTIYNLINLENQIFKNNGNSLYTWLQINNYDYDTMRIKLNDMRPKNVNPKYKELLSQAQNQIISKDCIDKS